MRQNLIPNTELRISKLCLGTMTFGSPVAEADAIRIVHWALDHGINFIDTADIYEGYARVVGSPGGVAEEILGKALQGRRDRAVVTTKVGNSIGSGNYSGQGLGRAHILHQADESLRRLRTSHIDLYELHRPDAATPLEESIAAMADLISAGKIRHWGFSNFEAPQIVEMVTLCDRNNWPRPVVSQPPYSWLTREIETEHLPACHRMEIAVTPYRVLESGLLTGKYRSNQPAPADSRGVENPKWIVPAMDDVLFRKLDAFEQEARQAGLTPTQHAVQWVLNQPGIFSAVVGVKRVDQLQDLSSIL